MPLSFSPGGISPALQEKGLEMKDDELIAVLKKIPLISIRDLEAALLRQAQQCIIRL